MKLGADTGINRHHIIVQIQEPIDNNNPDNAAALEFCKNNRLPENIAEISKERIRRAGKKILEGKCHENWNKDIGFRVLKIDVQHGGSVLHAGWCETG